MLIYSISEPDDSSSNSTCTGKMRDSSRHRDTKVTEDVCEYPSARQIITRSIFAHRVQYVIHYRGKGKAIPVQAWTEPEGNSRFRLRDFKAVDTRILQEIFLAFITV